MFLVQTRGYSRTVHVSGVQCFSTLKKAVEYVICVYVGVYTNAKVGAPIAYWSPPDPYEKFAYWVSRNIKITEVFVDDALSKSKAVTKKKIRETVKEYGMKV